MYPKLRLEFSYREGQWEWTQTMGFPHILGGNQFDPDRVTTYCEEEIASWLNRMVHPRPSDLKIMADNHEILQEEWDEYWSDDDLTNLSF